MYMYVPSFTLPISLCLFLSLCLSLSDTDITYPDPEELCRTEVFEYALGLSKTDFSLPLFQTYKLLHVIKLVEAGLVEKVHTHTHCTCTCIHVHTVHIHTCT